MYNIKGLKRFKLILKYLLGPLSIPYCLINVLITGNYTPLLSCLDTFYSPIWCFVTDVINYLILLGLVFTVCLKPQVNIVPNYAELAMWLCTVSRILTELEQLYAHGKRRYWRNFWNYVELLSCIPILTSAITKITIWMVDSLTFYLIYTCYFNAVAEFMFILRGLSFIEVSSSIEPLMIAVKSMMSEVLKFFWLF